MNTFYTQIRFPNYMFSYKMMDPPRPETVWPPSALGKNPEVFRSVNQSTPHNPGSRIK